MCAAKRPPLSPHHHAKAVAVAKPQPATTQIALMEALKQLDTVVSQEQAMMGFSFWRCYGQTSALAPSNGNHTSIGIKA
jgi:malonyl CoA-acyl carrier protein transacylase